MTGIVEFLTARLDEDDALAREASAFYDDDAPNGVPWNGHEGEDLNGHMRYWIAPHLGVVNDMASGRHIGRHDPARVLREVEAKRVLLQWCANVTKRFDWSTLNQFGSLLHDPNALATNTATMALCTMAAPYADHPDYKASWNLPT